MFYISEKEDSLHENKIYGVIYLPFDSIPILRVGQVTEVYYEGLSYPFLISDFGNIANEEGKFPISLIYVDTMNIFTIIKQENCIAKIQMSNQTIYKKLFAHRLNILNSYKIK